MKSKADKTNGFGALETKLSNLLFKMTPWRRVNTLALSIGVVLLIIALGLFLWAKIVGCSMCGWP